jgi:ABC-type transport system involved in multi-copper enzyme maturation permease subunit
MLAGFLGHLRVTLLWALRDRILHAVFGVSLLLLLLAPLFSSFSMRQVQETALTLTLSTAALVLLVLAVQLGSGAIFRDIERRYTAVSLTLPLPRGAFVLGRFAGIALVLIVCAALFALLTLLLVPWAASLNPSDRPIIWSTVFLAYGLDACMAILLSAFALLLSCVSTSFTLPFFCSIGLYMAGSASQQVFDYLVGPMGERQPYLVRVAGEALYYLLPNFSAFDLHLQAIYGLPLQFNSTLTTFAYFSAYTALLVFAATLLFGRRELP